MASDKEPAKLLLPYLQRADELQKHEPLVAYYCRLYAMERGLKIPQRDRTKTTNALLVSLMNQLERDKKSLQLGPDDHLHVEGFALNVFAKADKQDRAGRADLSTAKTFYAASIFFEVLNQFGQLQPDVEQKQKYAVWKAADIRKALKEGRKPLPGPPDTENDLLEPSSASSVEHDVEPDRTDFAAQPNLTSIHPAGTNASESDPSVQPYSQDDFQHPNISSGPSSVTQYPGTPPAHYPTDNYPTDGIHQQHSASGSTHSTYDQQPYYPPTYQQEPLQNLPQHYPSYDVHSLPNFQTYPSFSESSLPTAPSHYPSFRQTSDASYPTPSPNPATYSPTSPYNSGSKNGNASDASTPNTQKYEYDSSYQPPPDKIAEAHKAARFAVGALAFDDVFVAVDYLKKSLELLTNPSAN